MPAWGRGHRALVAAFQSLQLRGSPRSRGFRRSCPVSEPSPAPPRPINVRSFSSYGAFLRARTRAREAPTPDRPGSLARSDKRLDTPSRCVSPSDPARPPTRRVDRAVPRLGIMVTVNLAPGGCLTPAEKARAQSRPLDRPVRRSRVQALAMVVVMGPGRARSGHGLCTTVEAWPAELSFSTFERSRRPRRGRRVDRRLDEFGHGCRLRDVDRMAARDLRHGRTRPR